MANIEMLKELFAAKEDKEERGIMRITINKDGTNRRRSYTYRMTDSQWHTLLATLETQNVNYEHITSNAVIIINYEKG